MSPKNHFSIKKKLMPNPVMKTPDRFQDQSKLHAQHNELCHVESEHLLMASLRVDIFLQQQQFFPNAR